MRTSTLLACWAVLIASTTLLSADDSPRSDTSPKPPLAIASWDDALAAIRAERDWVVVVNLWSTTCGTCRDDFPEYVRLSEQFKKQPVTFLSFNCDYDGIPGKPPDYYRARVEAFLTRHKAQFRSLILAEPLDELLESGRLPALPAVLVFDRAGKQHRVWKHAEFGTPDKDFSWTAMAEAIDTLLTPDP